MSLIKFSSLIFYPILSLVVSASWAANVYIDNTIGSDCTSSNYSVASRNCTGTDGNAYRTIQNGINNASVGDVIYMRGGTYNEVAIDIPESKNGTAWTAGNFTTLMSYPGEWAIVDATGLNTSAVWPEQSVFTHPTGYGVGSPSQYTSYWKFSNFEVTGGRSGFFLKADHIKWQYMYIHNNGRSAGAGLDTLIGGIVSVGPRYSEIKYSYFKDNVQTVGGNLNNANILFDADYKDNNGNGGTFDPNAAIHSNEIAYNYFTGSRISIRHKNQQRFGYNDRDPNDMTYKNYGDKIHHNIVLDADESIGVGQDFTQIYNNITDSTINYGRVSGADGDVPIVYNAVVYNNTVKRDSTDSSYGSFVTTGGYDEAMYNFYDVKDGSGNVTARSVHEHVWFYNNIADNNTTDYQDTPFIFHWNIPANSSAAPQDNSDLVFDRNLIHYNAGATPIIVGHNYDASFLGCDSQYHTASSISSCSETWRGVTGILNWENNTSDLFQSTTGYSQYITEPTFALDSTKTICDGGKSGNHPYLTGVSIPSYVGATNPNANAWVFAVFNEVSSVDWLKAQTDENPSWTEENTVSSSVCKSPPKAPSGVEHVPEDE